MAKSFYDEVDKLGYSLLKEAKKAELSEKIAIFAHCVKWAAVKNKEPDDGQGQGWKIGDSAGGESSEHQESESVNLSSNSTVGATQAGILSESYGSSGGGDSDDFMPDIKPTAHSFPVIDGSVHSKFNGSTRPPNGSDSSSGDL